MVAMSRQAKSHERCTSCGRTDEPVMAVHRVYVTPEAWDTRGKVDVVDEVEHWCFVCRTHYPHEDAAEI